MIVYQVELEADLALRDDCLAWLHEHLREMLTLPWFLSAELLERRDPPAPAGRWVVRAQYRLRDRAAWEGYLANDAARMRESGVVRFGERVRATRTLLEAL